MPLAEDGVEVSADDASSSTCRPNRPRSLETGEQARHRRIWCWSKTARGLSAELAGAGRRSTPRRPTPIDSIERGTPRRTGLTSDRAAHVAQVAGRFYTTVPVTGRRPGCMHKCRGGATAFAHHDGVNCCLCR